MQLLVDQKVTGYGTVAVSAVTNNGMELIHSTFQIFHNILLTVLHIGNSAISC